MNKPKQPKTDSAKELAEFWDTHDITGFEDELEEILEPVIERTTPISSRRRKKENRMANKTDHEVSAGNVFTDLGVPDPKEALAKADIAAEICRVIARRGWTRARAAGRMGIALTDLARLRRGEHAHFSTDQMRQFLDVLLQDRTNARRGKTAASALTR